MPSPRTARHCDVLVIGGGPSGATASYWLASAGHDVVMVERKSYPREKTCGDGLTPRSVRQLLDMGLGDELAGAGHRYDGLRSHGFGRTLELKWPEHPDLPGYGYVITRKDLDALVARRAEKAGAEVWEKSEAIAPLVEQGLVRGGLIKDKTDPDAEPVEVRARYVVVADGANSRFGRALGTSRNRSYPLGMAIRGYYYSPRHDEPWIDSWLDIRDKAGNVLPGYGWIFPVGDGRINVGIGLLSTFNQWKAVNTTHLLESFVDYAPESWDMRPETACGPATGGRLPMGLSVGPHAGPTYLVVGDAGGTINPFNGEGIAYAYETGRIAADAVHLALASGDGMALQTYEQRLQDTYALYYKVARAFVKIIGHPQLMRALVTTGMRSRPLMEWVLRIMANLLRPDELGPAEAAYKAVAAIARLAPERSA
ncbi:geranylgeranyl reductase family protein [Acidiferrimicrobium sp. IK]|uniref:geranylgeranyl reductase family protein n=1 Tax=Acidiferrimicrobium sp. IK TaxID=2871700 RepID=UPI0021CB5D81|nr:geranylgeranyl reductase family protein [Acidiferrimicrobium sp. IK]MCU4183161.1 geranylgeranyl reductase family protein [Acidiferrimicrobium sp. IK]